MLDSTVALLDICPEYAKRKFRVINGEYVVKVLRGFNEKRRVRYHMVDKGLVLSFVFIGRQNKHRPLIGRQCLHFLENPVTSTFAAGDNVDLYIIISRILSYFNFCCRG